MVNFENCAPGYNNLDDEEKDALHNFLLFWSLFVKTKCLGNKQVFLE